MKKIVNFWKQTIEKKSPNQNALKLNELWVHSLHETFPTLIVAGLNFELAFFFGWETSQCSEFVWKKCYKFNDFFEKKMPKFEKAFSKNFQIDIHCSSR